MKKLLFFTWIICLFAIALQSSAQTRSKSLKELRVPNHSRSSDIDKASRNERPSKRACTEASSTANLRFQHQNYTLTYLKHISARQEKNGRYHSNVVIEIERISPTFDHKGFDLHDLFLGSIEVCASLQRLNENNQVVDTKTYTKFVPNRILEERYYYSDFESSKNCPLKWKDIAFSIKGSDLQKHIQLIDDYEKQMKKLEDYSAQLEELEQPDLRYLDKQVDEINNLSYKIKALEHCDFRNLNLPKNSSEDFAYQLLLLQNSYADLQSTLPDIYYDAGIQKLRYPVEAKRYFEATLRLNPQHIGARNEMANIHFAENNIAAYLQDIEELERMRYDGTDRLVNKAFNWFLDAASIQANHPTDYEGAMVIYEDAKQLCRYGYVRDCFGQLENRKQQVMQMIGAKKTQLYEAMLYDAMQAANYKRFGDAQNLLREAALYQQNNPSWVPLTLSTHQTLSHVYCTMIVEAKDQVQRGALTQARQALNEISVLENDWTYWNWTRNNATCNGQLEQAFGNLYESYLDNAVQASYRNNFKSAQQSLAEAEDLCRKKQVNCGVELEEAYFKVQEAQYQQTIQMGQQQFRNRQYVKAIEYFKTAEGICKQDTRITCATSLAGGLFDSYFAMAEQKAISKDYETATTYFRKAQANIDDYQPSNYAQLQRQLMNAMQGIGEAYISDRMLATEQAIRKNDLWKANTIRGKIADLIETYHLQSNKIIGDKMAAIDESIQSQHCINTATEISNRFLGAKKMADNQAFINANTTIEIALKLSKENNVCGISTSKLHDLQSQILPAADHQRMMQQIDNLISAHQYESAIEAYLQAEEHASTHQLKQKLNINHPNLYTFLQKSHNGWLQVTGIQHFRELEGWASTRSLIRILASSYSSKITKKLFLELGKRLARTDKIKGGISSKEAGVEQYQTNDFKIYKKFRKAYWKEWGR